MLAVAKVHNGIIGKVFQVDSFDAGVEEIRKIVVSEFEAHENTSDVYTKQHHEQLKILENEGVYLDNVRSYQVIEIE